MHSQEILSQIGHTPLVRADKFLAKLGIEAHIYVKCEGFNPAGSIKDRAALFMIEAGERSGAINEATAVIEATSGNTGIGLALLCAQRGYRLILTMPDNMSMERRSLLQAMGAELVLTPATQGMQGAVDKAAEIAASLPASYIAGQFTNPANAEAHYQTTAPEIWQATDGRIDILVATIGSGGTISGCGRYFKEKNPHIRIVGVEPAESPLISTGQAGPHIIQGIGANFIPQLLDRSVIDEMMTVEGDTAVETARLFGRSEGNLVGISSGAALAAAVTLARQPDFAGKCIVAILPDRGERYMSTQLFAPGE